MAGIQFKPGRLAGFQRKSQGACISNPWGAMKRAGGLHEGTWLSKALEEAAIKLPQEAYH